jgi:WXG100 family type VII secretion target
MKKKRKGGTGDMQIDLVELERAAEQFSKASHNTEIMVEELEKTMKRLESSWEDSGQQVFFQYYKEWQQYMQGTSEILVTISKNMRAIAKNYSEADFKKIISD